MKTTSEADSQIDRPPTSRRATESSLDSGPSKVRDNFILLAAYQVVVRTGWIFKTESIVMPAVLDLTGAGAWMRAILPTLNRFGQTVPPILFSNFLTRQRLKKYSLATSTLVMGLCFLLLAFNWEFGTGQKVPFWFGGLFLVAYAVFFIATGLNQLSFGTLQGKLIPYNQRGSLLLCSNLIGVAVAITAVLVFLPRWLSASIARFDWIFGFTAVCFLISTLLVLGLRETKGPASPIGRQAKFRSREFWSHFREDVHLRRIALVGACLGSSLMLFPHYQAMARERLGLGLEQIVLWLVVQNIGTALFSIPAGWIADRTGNRLVLRLCMGLLLVGPLLAWWLSKHPGGVTTAFAAVFFFIGLTPVCIRVLSNYTLELTSSEFHPIYLSQLGLFTGVPVMVLSPLLGVLVDWVGFDPVFGLVVLTTSGGWVLTFWIIEPRSNPDLRQTG
jgi:predicted MFS family arabinose efflux permease